MAERDPSDEALVRRFKSGDAEALRILFERYEDVLRARIQRWIPNHLRRRFSISDVLQEARMVAVERRGELEDRGEEAFKAWLARIAEWKARRAVQWHTAAAKRAVAREISRTNRPETAQFAAHGPSPSEAAMGAEVRRQVAEAMRALPEDYRTVLRLIREKGLSIREAAAQLERSYDATKKLYSRALYRASEEFERLRRE